MASRFLIIFFVLLSFSPLIISAVDDYGTELDPKTLGLRRKEKLTHFKLYWHDIGGNGTNATAVVVVNSPVNSDLPLFGQISIYDDPLTLGPEMNSTQVGKAQGFYAFVGQNETSLLQAQYFHFTEGKYNGSTIIIVGRDAFVTDIVREMPVIGGSGVFRFARGYAIATRYEEGTTYSHIEYNVYVLHY